MKKILSLFIFVLCVAFNANAQSYSLDNGLDWAVEDGVLTISGEGAIPDYTSGSEAPWSGKSFTSIVIEEGVTSIGDYAFGGFRNVTKVTIPSSVKSLGYQSFANCLSLSELYCYGSTEYDITMMGEVFDDLDMSFVFEGVVLSGVTLYYTVSANTTTELYGAFSNKVLFGSGNGLEWTLSGSVLSIKGSGNTAFSYLSAWDSYRVNIKSVALSGVNAKYSAPFVLSNDDKELYFSCSNGSAVTIPDGITEISEKAFYGLNLTSLVIPSSVNKIGDNAFNKCNNIKSVTVYPDVAPTLLGSTVFSSLIKLRKAELIVKGVSVDAYKSWEGYFYKVSSGPDNSGTFGTGGKWNFDENTSTLTVAGYPVGDYTAGTTPPWNDWLSSAKKIVIGDGVSSIGNNAFQGTSASTIVISDDVKSIGEFAFYSNTISVNTIEVGSKVETIGARAFIGTKPDAVFTFGNNPFIASDAMESDVTKNLVIEEVYVDNHYTAANLMLNTNTYNKVTVKRLFSGKESGSVIFPFAYDNINNSDLKFYKLSSFNSSSAVLKFEEVIHLDANVPYLWRNLGSTVSEIVVDGEIEFKAAAMSDELSSENVSGWKMYGVYKETRAVPTSEEGVNSNLWYYKADGSFQNRKDFLMLAPYRAYFIGPRFSDLSSSSQNLAAELRSLSVEYVDIDGTTSIENVTIESDGTIDFSQQDGVYYDLSGRRVENPSAGIYIVNGKKVLVK